MKAKQIYDASKNSRSGIGKQATAIELERLIAEIDSETGIKVTGPARDVEEKTAATVSGRTQFIRFLLGDILLAIPLASALEIGHKPEIRALPNLPDWILGVSNIRGEIVSIVDLNLYFKLKSYGPKRDRRFIIVHNQDMKVGIVVDRVMGIISLEQPDLESMDVPYHEGEIAEYISGVISSDQKMLNILDIDKLLASSRMNSFRGE